MVNEATKVELFGQKNDGDPIRYRVASGVAIAKGTLLAVVDAREASGAFISSMAKFCGIAAMDKKADDFSTSISAWQNGVFEMLASGAIAVGNMVVMAGGQSFNQIMDGGSASFAHVVGKALETADDEEVINVRVNL